MGIERESSGQAPADQDQDAFTLLILDPSVAHGKLMHALEAKSNWQVLAELEHYPCQCASMPRHIMLSSVHLHSTALILQPGESLT